MIYIVKLFQVEKKENTYEIVKKYDNAYFTNLYNAQASVVNNMGNINDNIWNYISIVGVQDNKLFANDKVLDAYFYEYIPENQRYDNLSETSEVYTLLTKDIGYEKQKIVQPEQKISLDLTKEDTNFMNSMKDNFAKKNYNEMFNMLSQKEATVSDELNNQLNEFVKVFEDGFTQLENGINNFFSRFK